MSIKTSISLPSSTSLRLRQLASRIHRLGERPFFELLAEVVAGSSDPAVPMRRIEAYAAINGDVLRAYGGDRIAPNLWRVK
jgi:hypothetical protein